MMHYLQVHKNHLNLFILMPVFLYKAYTRRNLELNANNNDNNNN